MDHADRTRFALIEEYKEKAEKVANLMSKDKRTNARADIIRQAEERALRQQQEKERNWLVKEAAKREAQRHTKLSLVETLKQQVARKEASAKARLEAKHKMLEEVKAETREHEEKIREAKIKARIEKAAMLKDLQKVRFWRAQC